MLRSCPFSPWLLKSRGPNSALHLCRIHQWPPPPLLTPSACHLTWAHLVSMPSNQILTSTPIDHLFGWGNFCGPLLVSWVPFSVLPFHLCSHFCCLRQEGPLLSALDLQELPIPLLVSSSPIPPGEGPFGHASLGLWERHLISIQEDKLGLSRAHVGASQ